ncbi:hypothetical protein [Bacillus halotolerans]|uniref:hypothetical protein n=1 Tax=Bacillus halotolerans TaxID=260554 RepID=UPI0020C3A637|nr:hypothetical protein [Bacillus halotolerans]UTL74844.1 hypothetical protein NLW79_11355 [Bacillus halotolerans]
MKKNELKKALEYNTKNAGQQLLQLTIDWNVHIDRIEKKDMINTIQDIAMHMLQQWEKYKKYDEDNSKEVKEC